MLCVRWYLRYKLSFRDLVEMMAERGLSLAHTTIMRWIQGYAPEFERRRTALSARWASRGASTKPTSKSRVAGPIPIVPSTKRERPSMFCFAPSETSPRPRRSSDGRSGARGDCRIRSRSMAIRPLIAAAKEVLGEHPEGNRCAIRSSKYLNNLIEQDHRSIKLRLGPMLGFKRFRSAATTIAGIELMHRIRKGQFRLGKLLHQKQDRARNLERRSHRAAPTSFS